MTPFTRVEGRAYPLALANVDTDLIIPAAHLKTIRRSGLGAHAFEAVRREPGNVFDEPRFAGAPILIAGENFGCGSSREHAPWAILDFGIRCVIAESFADIFYNNSFKNGILPIKLPKDQVEILMKEAEENPGVPIDVDLEKQLITRGNKFSFYFDIDPFRKHCLLNGLDDIGLTEVKSGKISDYEDKRATERPWL